MSIACIQDILKCDSCKFSSDMYGRNCKHGMLFPLLLIMGNKEECPNYIFDSEKVKLQIKEEKDYDNNKNNNQIR